MNRPAKKSFRSDLWQNHRRYNRTRQKLCFFLVPKRLKNHIRCSRVIFEKLKGYHKVIIFITSMYSGESQNMQMTITIFYLINYLINKTCVDFLHDGLKSKIIKSANAFSSTRRQPLQQLTLSNARRIYMKGRRSSSK